MRGLGPAGVLLMTACDLTGPQSALDPAGPIAQAQRDLFMWTYWLSWLVMFAVAGVLVYSLVRFRARDAADRRNLPRQTHGSSLLEVVWTAIPVILVILVAVPTVRTIFDTEYRIYRAEYQETDVIVRATGYQWWFKFEYPDAGVVTANEMVIPVGRRVVVELEAADVLHSFWVPNLAGKRDMIPNQDNQLWFTADQPGTYYGQCAEFCLGAHAYMRFRVMAVEEDEYQAWLEAFQGAGDRLQQASGDAQVQRGRQLMAQKGCIGCHTVDGFYPGIAVGSPDFPDLTNFGMRTTVAAALRANTPENLAAWLRDPQAVKPGNYMPTLWHADDPAAEEEIAAVVAFLLSLGAEHGETTAALGGTHGDR
jgi:cytochrome c oxidase subunit II